MLISNDRNFSVSTFVKNVNKKLMKHNIPKMSDKYFIGVVY
ncbi:hypothetical protein EMST110833_14015 [Empedobacter stercoris]